MHPKRGADKPHVVVLGAGFAGLTFCKRLTSGLARVTLLDRQNHHLFQPLLYQVATAGLAAPDIAQPVRSILRDRRDVTVLMSDVTGVDLARREVSHTGGVLGYDYLVIALGGRTSYFGHEEWARHAPGLKSIDDALAIRRRVLSAFEDAEVEDDEARRGKLMTIVVVGGGPTGVEMAGALAELSRTVLRRDFRRIDPAKARVILVEGGPRVLGAFPANLSAKAERQLRRLGVEVRTGVAVREIHEDGLELASGERLAAANVIWGAGVSAVPLAGTLGVPTDRAGRLRVEPDLSLPGWPSVFAAGDIVSLTDPSGRVVPGVSPAAMQMGRYIARTIAGELGTVTPPRRKPFCYFDKGTMATIGRSAAVAKIGWAEFCGWPAWAAWLVVHILFLIGFRNRISVLLQWTYSYFTYRRGARLITGLDPEREAQGAEPAAGPENRMT